MPRLSGRTLFRQWLKQHALSQAFAASSLGVSEAAIHNWLSDDGSPPRPLQRRKIARWTTGEVPEDSWEAASERRELAAVKPYMPPAAESGDTLDRRREPTGTEG